MSDPPLPPLDYSTRVCVYCGPRAAFRIENGQRIELLETVNGEQRCIDRIDCQESREAQGIRSSTFRFREKVAK